MTQKSKLVTVRELRAHVALVLNAPMPAVIGSRWHLRALIIPIPRHYPYDRGKRRAARAETKRRCLAALAMAFNEER